MYPLPSVLLKPAAALIVSIHSLPRMPSLLACLGLIIPEEAFPYALGCNSSLPPLPLSSRFTLLVCGLAHSSGVSSNVISSARGLA